MAASLFKTFSDKSVVSLRYCGPVPVTKEAINRALAAEIRAAAGRADISLAEVGRRTGISEPTMQRIAKGADLQVSKLYLISDALGVSPTALVEAAVAAAEAEAE